MKRMVWVALAVCVAVGAVLWSGLLSPLTSTNYLPHRYCYLAQPGLIWTNVSMDGLIAASYFLIFGSLFWMASRLQTLDLLREYIWILLAFGTFIVACGLTHVMEVVTIWMPVYRLSAAVKVLCAAASVPTAVVFVRAAPTLTSHMQSFIQILSTTQKEKDQALASLIASEKLAVAGRMSATIAHEVSGPLQSVGDLLYVLRGDSSLPSELQATVALAEAEIQRAAGIARSTLSLYRDSSDPVAVELEPLVTSVIELQKAALARQQIAVQLRVRTSYPIQASSSELRQILINLVHNSMAATAPGGRIFVRVQPRRSGYSLTVADEGSGIEPENRRRLFSLFFTTKGEHGNGLGLWLVHSLVDKHGGTVRFRSRVAGEARLQGTLFNIWLPAQR